MLRQICSVDGVQLNVVNVAAVVFVLLRDAVEDAFVV